jgi:hypothetical protein
VGALVIAGGDEVTAIDGGFVRGWTVTGGGARRGGSGTCSTFRVNRLVPLLEFRSAVGETGARRGAVEQPASARDKPMAILPGVNTPVLCGSSRSTQDDCSNVKRET